VANGTLQDATPNGKMDAQVVHNEQRSDPLDGLFRAVSARGRCAAGRARAARRFSQTDKMAAHTVVDVD